MPIFAYLPLYRSRLTWAALIAIIFTLGMLYITSADSLFDVGVLWHHFCGCAPAPSDVYAMICLPVVACGATGVFMGLGVGTGVGPNPSGITTPGAAEMCFLFTRPTKRATVLLAPLAIATAAIVVIPAAVLCALTGWLWLVHSPALGHLLDIVRLVPSAANIGPHPSPLHVIRAAHMLRFYASAVSIGVCTYAFYFGQRWWIRSPQRSLRIAGAFGPLLLPILPAISFSSPRLVLIALLNIATPRSLAMQPSSWLIGAHLSVAAFCLLSAWQIARSAEL